MGMTAPTFTRACYPRGGRHRSTVRRLMPDPALPLAGLRVLDCSRVLAGPFATMLLADLGADVIKLEPPGGDESRGWGPPFWGDPADRVSAYFAAVNRNKRSIVVDLRTDGG